MIKRQHPGLSTGLVFPADARPESARFGGYRLPGSIQKVLNAVCEKAEIKKRLTPHSMRRTFNNLLRQVGVDEIAIRALTGHSSPRMTELYSNVDLEERRKAITDLSRSIGRQEETEGED